MSNNILSAISHSGIDWNWLNSALTGNRSSKANDISWNTDTPASDYYVDQIYVATLTIADTASTTLNLIDGSLKDFAGGNFVISKLKFAYFHFATGGVGDLNIKAVGDGSGGATTLPKWLDKTGLTNKEKPVKQGGVVVESAPLGYDVANAHAQDWYGFTLTNNSGASGTVNVVILGKA